MEGNAERPTLDLEPVTEEARLEYETRSSREGGFRSGRGPGVRFIGVGWPRGPAGVALGAAVVAGVLLFFYIILPLLVIGLIVRVVLSLLARLGRAA
ncbi:MAG: hypothetical protein MOGMAGMI_00692 [Candidatus Omnitrophica bacterium]|nr:hypothetical protein [Candidatus Omnitrophota bacterium]